MFKSTILGIALFLANDAQAIHSSTYLGLGAQSDPICNSAGCTQFRKADPAGHPMNYFVPDFGVDRDIIDNHENMKDAESLLGHQLTYGEKGKGKDAAVDYVGKGSLGVDADVAMAQASGRESEKEHH